MSVIPMRTLLPRISIAAAVVGLAVTVAPAASAAPVIDSMRCVYTGGSVLCEIVATYSQPATIRWYINGSPAPAFNNSEAAVGACPPRGGVTMTVVVTDPTGSVTGHGGRSCSGPPDPV